MTQGRIVGAVVCLLVARVWCMSSHVMEVLGQPLPNAGRTSCHDVVLRYAGSGRQ
jgi:hypothetical protein